MEMALVFARLLLVVVLAVAGVAKLIDRPAFQRTLADFGVPGALSPPVALLLPLAELVLAIALLPVATAWWAAWGALALLLLFTAGIGANLARGRKPDCRCFGQIQAAPVGGKTLVRNGLLSAVAAFVVWQGWVGGVGPSLVGWIGELSAVGALAIAGAVVLLGTLAATWWFMLGLMKQNGRLLARLEALEESFEAEFEPEESEELDTASIASSHADGAAPELNGPAPAFSLPDLQGREVTLDSLRALGRPIMLLFTDPGCEPCESLLPDVSRWQREHADALTIALITRGTAEANRAKSTQYGLERVLVQKNWEVADAYGAAGTPSAMLLRSNGTVASPLAQAAMGIERLVQHAVQHAEQHAEQSRASSRVGEAAPEVRLPDLSGDLVGLEDLGGGETLVLFWSPDCGFCQQMLPDLKAWEENPPEGAPKLLIVSAGTPEANRQMGLRSTVVLDEGFSTGQAFGAVGTPSAVLIDADGKIASAVATGTQEVLALAGARQRVA